MERSQPEPAQDNSLVPPSWPWVGQWSQSRVPKVPCSPKTVSPDVCRGTFHIQTMMSAALTRLGAMFSSTWLYRKNNCTSTATTKARTIPLHEHSSANLFSCSNCKLVHPSHQSLLLPTVGSDFVLYLLVYSPDLSKEWDPDLWPPQLSTYSQGRSQDGKWDFFSTPGLQTSLWERSWLVRTFFRTPAGGKQCFGSGQAPDWRNQRTFSWLCPFAKPASTNYLKGQVMSAGPWLSSFGYQTDRWSASVAPWHENSIF